MMSIRSVSWRSVALRAAGVALLVAAWRVAVESEAIGRAFLGHEPARIYLLCLLAFACASVGAALLANGVKLFGKVPVGALWSSHLGEDEARPAADPSQAARPLRLVSDTAHSSRPSFSRT
jgi:hypothetical protein